ncbi:hypothetical protein KJ713_02900 [Patescibacteria group bacterium]|nr:hypothetical protein [Patescibacteria group bacterium]
MAKHEGIVIQVVKELKDVAFGRLNNGESVFIIGKAVTAGCDFADGPIENKYVLGVIKPNDEPERQDRTPWVCININRMATEEEFQASTPLSIKDIAGSNGNDNHDIVVDPDELDDAADGLGTTIASMLPPIDEKTEKKRISAELTDDEDIDPDDPRHAPLVKTRLKEVKAEREKLGRSYTAQLLTKGAIPGLIIEEAKRLVELGPEVYWSNASTPTK